MVYSKEKLENGIAYIAIIHNNIKNKPAYQTYIYKYLALIDFAYIETTGRSVFGLDYHALKNGPIPAQLYDNRNLYVLIQPFKKAVLLEKSDDHRIIFKPIADPDLQYFSDDELLLIESTVESYATEVNTIEELCQITHSKIKAWEVAWKSRAKNRERVRINPLDTFPDILKKDPDELTPTEEAAIYTFHTFI